jgi:hypothetical protein
VRGQELLKTGAARGALECLNCGTISVNRATGGNFIAERSCRCSADSDAAAAVGHAGLHELLRQLDLLLGGVAADDVLRRCLVQVA